ncbi:MAG: SDR family oxidoreductase [Rudaea sp.]|uniref:SDR family NAD(P)-dependent oxidoreductase n=1 Tax=Rudaea sp. TaxID=2136325 RepID=UPI0039E46DF8
MSQRLANKIALVTGIGGGIGRGCALMFARHGATIIGCDINPATAAQTVADAAAEGLTIDSMHPVDLTQPNDVKRWIERAAGKHGRIDVLLNAAAIPPHMARIEDIDYERQWTPTMVGEADVVVLACHYAWPWLKASGKASIINFASVNAFRASTHFGMGPHCAGKAAVLALTRQLAIEGAPAIRANTISPGMVVTPATQSAGASTDGEIRERILARVPMKRLGQPEDIAWAAVFLASDESGWVTGANLPVDGGVMAN